MGQGNTVRPTEIQETLKKRCTGKRYREGRGGGGELHNNDLRKKKWTLFWAKKNIYINIRSARVLLPTKSLKNQHKAPVRENFILFLLINAIYSQAREWTTSDTYSHYVLTRFTAYFRVYHNKQKQKSKIQIESSHVTTSRRKQNIKELSSVFKCINLKKKKKTSPWQEWQKIQIWHVVKSYEVYRVFENQWHEREACSQWAVQGCLH